MVLELAKRLFRTVSITPSLVNSNDKKYDWLECDDLCFLYKEHLVQVHFTVNSLDKILICAKENNEALKLHVLQAELNMMNLGVDRCEFFYCSVRDNKIQDYTRFYFDNSNNIEILYKQYIHYQMTMLRRLLSQSRITGVKRRRGESTGVSIVYKDCIDPKFFISASRLKNYVFQDTLCDWLDEFHRPLINENNKEENLAFIKGIEFEELTISYLKSKFPNQWISISSNPGHSLDVAKFYETICAMNMGTPIIFHGVLHNNIDHTFGIPDIIIRSDYLEKLGYKDVDCVLSPIFNVTHYRIIDIKSSMLKLKSSGGICNNPIVRYYKTQVYLYNTALGIIQGYTPPEAYLMVNSWKVGKGKKKTSYKLAKVDYEDEDRYITELYVKAVSWIKYLRKNGSTWDPYERKIAELLPNMKNRYDSTWNGYKKDLVSCYSDITELWNCSVRNRLVAITNGIYCWRTQNINSTMLGIYHEQTASTLDMIINVNKYPQEFGYFHPKKITNNYGDWKNKAPYEFFIDFEGVTTMDYIFMIGVGFIKNNRWKYVQFIADDLNETEEKKMFEKFLTLIRTYENPVLFHWGDFERNCLLRKVIKYKLKKMPDLVDILQIFKTEPIVVNGALNYGLKSIAKAMYKHKFIKSTWVKNLDGMYVSQTAKKIYTGKWSNDTFKKITDYNEVDCKVLYEILKFLRKKI